MKHRASARPATRPFTAHTGWLLALVALAGLVVPALAQNSLSWTAAASGTTNGWSTAGNWTNAFFGTTYIPPFSNTISFSAVTVPNPATPTNLVDNVVDANFVVAGISYVEDAAHAHTTLINPGATLTLSNAPGVAGNLLAMGNVTADSAAQLIWSVIGTNGARLVAGDPSAPDILDQIVISERFNSVTPFTQRGTLDLSRLDEFTFAGGILQIGSNPSGGKDWPRGRVYLARTNLIMAGQTTTPSIKVGHLAGTGTGGDADLQLGQTNAIFAHSLKIGGNRLSVGTIEFQAGLNNPSLFLRGVDGVIPAVFIGIGDSLDQNANVNATATGIADFTGGTVDVLVTDLFVGRNLSNVANSTGHGNGTLTWTAGKIEATNLNIGSQGANNRGNATGTVNVRSNALLKVTTLLNIGADVGANTGTGNGTLNIVHGGVVLALGNVIENNAGGANGTSTINLTNGTLAVGGVLTVDTLNVSSGTVSNTGLATVTTLKGAGTVAGPVTVNGSLTPGNGFGTLNVTSNLTLAGTCTSVFDVNIDNGAHDMVVGLSNVTYGGTLAISPTGVGLALTNGGTIKLFDALTYSGSFAAMLPATPLPGFVWVTNTLTTTGTLGIRQLPVATTDNVTRTAGLLLKIPKATLLANDLGGPLSVTAVSATSTNNAALTTDAAYVYYTPQSFTPADDVTDRFTYTISDGVSSTNGTVVVSIAPVPPGITLNITGVATNGDGNYTISFAGIPGQAYAIEATTNFVNWERVATNTAGPNGLWSFTDLDSTNYPSRFYRSAQP